MTAQRSFDGLIDRVWVLLEGTDATATRRIAKNTYRRWTARVEPGKQPKASMSHKPMVAIWPFGPTTPSEASARSEKFDRHLEDFSLGVTLGYDASGGGSAKASDRTGANLTSISRRYGSDILRIRYCLCYPGNLPNATTGLRSGLLVYEGASELELEDGIAMGTLTFSGTLSIEPPDPDGT